jgi:hypothetical protein
MWFCLDVETLRELNNKPWGKEPDCANGLPGRRIRNNIAVYAN